MGFYIGYNVVYTASCYVSGLLADHFPKNRVLAIGYAVAVVPAVALLWPGDSFVKFGVVFGFAGLYMGVWENPRNHQRRHAAARHVARGGVRGAGHRQRPGRLRVQRGGGRLVGLFTGLGDGGS